MKYSYRTLGSLSDQRLLESGPVQTAGRPRDFHYLSKANASRGIVLGGHEAGLGERRSKEQYGLHGLPAHVEHAHARNGLYLALAEAARRKDSGAEIPMWGLWAESHPDSPLHAAKKSEKVYPDGLFEVRFEGLACRYYLEFESRSRPGYVLSKLDSYGAHFRRLLKEDGGGMEGWLRPLIFLFPESSTAVHMANVVSGAVRADAPELQRYLAWRGAAAKKGIRAGRLVLFASMETITARGALGVEYAASERYPESQEGVGAGGGVVDLEAVAEEVAEALAPDGEEG